MIFKAYIGLFALLSTLCNPWGTDDEAIFLWPKLVILFLIAALNQYSITKANSRIIWHWLIGWFPWLACASISTWFAILPHYSVLGYYGKACGLLWWITVAVFFLFNRLILKERPELFQAQLTGFHIGGVINAAAGLTQWVLHFFGIGFEQYPMHGLFGNFGAYAGFMLMCCAVAAQYKANKWLLVLYTVATLNTGVRIAMLGAVICNLIAIGWKRSIPVVLSALVFIGVVTNNKQVGETASPHTPVMAQIRRISSNRTYYWARAFRYAQRSPLIGYGFNGLNLQKAFRQCREVGILQYSRWSYQCSDGAFPDEDTKHSYNIWLDRLIETGFLGLLAYGWLWAWLLWTIRGRVLLVWSIFLLWSIFWYDAAAFSWIIFWIFSNGESFRHSKRTARTSSQAGLSV